MRALLATDACIEIIRGNPAPLDAHPEASPVISQITRFEILSGLRRRAATRREQRARLFLKMATTLPFDDDAAEAAAAIRIHLEGKGTPIGAYDLLIAGHAQALGYTLVSNNASEFSRVPGLTLMGWE